MSSTREQPNSQQWISRQQLAAWGLLDQVVRMEALDALLHDQPPPTAKEMQGFTQQWCEQHHLNSIGELEQWRQQHGLSLEQWQLLIARPKRWLRWCEGKFKHRVKTHFLQRKARLDRVTYSLIRVKDEDLAWELFHRIQANEHSFQDLARTHSEGHERDSGGLLGPVPLSQPHPYLAELLRISQPGKLWTPKKLEGWWVIVRLERHHPARFSELRSMLSLELGEEHLKDLLKQATANSHPSSTPLLAHP